MPATKVGAQFSNTQIDKNLNINYGSPEKHTAKK
jgi:hypothetical protein